MRQSLSSADEPLNGALSLFYLSLLVPWALIRQQSYAQQSAETTAQEAVDAVSSEAERLANAEAAMASMLERVNSETAQVEKAVEDLKTAQAEMDNDPLVKLKQGGIPKQAALAGFLLFTFRSIGDTIAAFTDENLLAGALVQGGIALAFAAVYFFI